jgi:hypothetical protein
MLHENHILSAFSQLTLLLAPSELLFRSNTPQITIQADLVQKLLLASILLKNVFIDAQIGWVHGAHAVRICLCCESLCALIYLLLVETLPLGVWGWLNHAWAGPDSFTMARMKSEFHSHARIAHALQDNIM